MVLLSALWPCCIVLLPASFLVHRVRLRCGVGGLGGMCMSLVCFPTDVIKARLMAQPRVPGKPDK